MGGEMEIKLKNAEGKYIDIQGCKGRTYAPLAKKSAGRKKLCKTVYVVMSACAYTALNTAISGGYNILCGGYSYALGRKVETYSQLPACLSDAVKAVETYCVSIGDKF